MSKGKQEKSLLEEAIDETRYRDQNPTHQVDYVRKAIERRQLALIGGCVGVVAVLMVLIYLVTG